MNYPIIWVLNQVIEDKENGSEVKDDEIATKICKIIGKMLLT